jgi:hypothetical protein
VKQRNNPERTLIQVYEKGSNFSKLLYSKTCAFDSTSRSYGRDTIQYFPELDYTTDYYKVPDSYDWKFTDSATGHVTFITDLRVESSTRYKKKYESCATGYKRWKVDGFPQTPKAYYPEPTVFYE